MTRIKPALAKRGVRQRVRVARTPDCDSTGFDVSRAKKMGESKEIHESCAVNTIFRSGTKGRW